MIKLDLSSIKNQAREVVESVPRSFVYVNHRGQRAADGGNTTCYYVHREEDGVELEAPKPGCIVGRILFGLGVPLDAMAKNETSSSGLLRSLAFNGVIEKPAPKVYMFLATLQRSQDLGATWYSALQVAMAALCSLEDTEETVII